MTRKRIFELIQIGDNDDFVSHLCDFIIFSAILINVFLAIFLTFKESEPYHDTIAVVEFITVLLFTVEYSLRVGTASFLYPNLSRFKASLKYIFSLTGLVDFFSFFPFYLPFLFPSAAVAFRVFRVVRILRLFRVHSYSDSLGIIINVVKSRKVQLLSSVFIIFILMTASSILMYNVEHQVQPDVFENAFSGFW